MTAVTRVAGGPRRAQDGAWPHHPGCPGAGGQHQRGEQSLCQEVQSGAQLERQGLDAHHGQQDGTGQGRHARTQARTHTHTAGYLQLSLNPPSPLSPCGRRPRRSQREL